MKALVVGQQDDACLRILELLESQGFNVQVANERPNALDMARSWQPRLIVTDVLMPHMDGFVLFDQVKSDPSLQDLAFVFYSGKFGDPAGNEPASAGSPSDFFVKPSDPQKFLRIINDAIESAAAGLLSAPRAPPRGESAGAGSRSLAPAPAEPKRRQRENRDAFNSLLRSMADAIIAVHTDGTITFANPAMTRLVGYTEEELIGRDLTMIMPERARARCRQSFSRYLRSGERTSSSGYAAVLTVLHRDGHEIDVEMSCTEIKTGEKGRRLIANLRDVSAHRQANQYMLALNQVYALSASCHRLLVHADDARDLLASYCRVFVDSGRYQIAWAGLADARAQTPAVTAAAMSGVEHAEGLLEKSGCVAGLNGSLVQSALDTGHCLSVNLRRDSPCSRCRASCRELRFRSALVLPLVHAATRLGVFAIYSENGHGFSSEERGILEELASDLADWLFARQTERAQKALGVRERAIEASSNGVVILDAQLADFPVVYANPSFESVTGYPADSAVGRNLQFLFGDDLDQPGVESLNTLLCEHASGSVTVRGHRNDSSVFWACIQVAPIADDDARVTHYVAVFSDISESIRYQEQLEHAATHDSLTGVASRTFLERHLSALLDRPKERRCSVAVCFVDVDRFKQINDTLGHKVGDQLLREVAQRLEIRLRRGDLVARFSGDEFVLVFDAARDEGAVNRICLDLAAALAQPFRIHGHEVLTSCSMGVSLYPRDAKTPATLIDHADTAMYRAKALGGDCVRFFTRQLSESQIRRVSIENALRRAIDRGELALHYQPQIHLDSDAIVGVEALARWHSGEHGVVPPDKFIPIAEGTGFILTLGQWILGEALGQLAAWRSAGLQLATIAVNVSNLQFQRGNFPETVRQLLAQHGVGGESLILDVNESLLEARADRVIAMMHELNAMGVRLAIDGFGIGYSWLRHLKHLPVDCLKIDRTFLREVPGEAADEAVIGGIVALAEKLGVEVVAEGVETRAQREFLLTQGCGLAQGFLLGHPQPSWRLSTLLRKQKGALATQVRSRPK